MKQNLKGLSGVVATALLLVVAVFAVISFQNFYTNYQSGVFVKAEQKSGSGNTGIETLVGNDLYFKNTQTEDLLILGVQIDGVECNIDTNSNASANSIKKIDVSSCVGSVSNPTAEIVVITENQVFSKYIFLKGASSSGGSSTVGNMTIQALGGLTNSNASFIQMYEYFATSNSHVSMPGTNNATRSLWTYHAQYTLGTACTGNYARMFYLGNTTNSHIWIDNSTAYEPYVGYYNWQEACISSSGGTIDLQYSSSDMTGSGYSCLASYIQNDTYGGVIGECPSHSNKIWIRII